MGVTPVGMCYYHSFVEFTVLDIHKLNVHFLQTTTPPMSVDTMLVFRNSSPSLFYILLAILCFSAFMQNSALLIRYTLHPNRSPIFDWASSWTVQTLGNTIPEHNTSSVTSSILSKIATSEEV